MGASTSDDAAVFQLTPELAVVTTVDFITPVVEDPYTWGRIAAANALSDVYAMGAEPIFALNTVNFPRDTLPLELLEQVLRGGSATALEAGISILGGHSVDDPEPKYGMVVVGIVHPGRVLRNVGARPGDALVLTKPLGIGIITTAIKRGLASAAAEAGAIQVMVTLNRAAGEAMVAAEQAIHAATDVTGFGLLGHLSEMLRAGGVGVELEAASVPVLEPAWDLARQDIVPGGTRRNLESLAGVLDWDPRLDGTCRLVLADAQTSGGLLIAVAPTELEPLLAGLQGRGVRWATPIGHFTTETGRIKVR